jgi:DNA repair/transcription protein MET18/MMS19
MVHWAIHTAPDTYTFAQAAELLTSVVNKRSEVLSKDGALEGLLQKIWVNDVQDTDKDSQERNRALHVFLHVSDWTCCSERGRGMADVQITRGLALLREPLAYSSTDRILDVLKLSSFDPAFVDASARGLGVIAKGKGQNKDSHHTAKVGLPGPVQSRTAIHADGISSCGRRRCGIMCCPRSLRVTRKPKVRALVRVQAAVR